MMYDDMDEPPPYRSPVYDADDDDGFDEVVCVTLDEATLRRPEWSEEVPVELRGGGWWSLPRIDQRVLAEFPDIADYATCLDCRVEIFRMYSVKGIANLLLRVNYNISVDEAASLVPDMFEDDDEGFVRYSARYATLDRIVRCLVKQAGLDAPLPNLTFTTYASATPFD
jgi:hypothetical protein